MAPVVTPSMMQSNNWRRISAESTVAAVALKQFLRHSSILYMYISNIDELL